jgi:pimeloyl-ACP methyl ester carboxylesterase
VLSVGSDRPDAAIDPPGHPDDSDRWRHDTAHVNGVAIHYVSVEPDPAAVEHPTGDAPLVVLLHGFPEFWYAWRHQLDPLADAGFRVVAPDLRGYNRSSAPEGVDSYRPAELVGDVRGLVEHLGYARAAVVGHDWGGLVAWESAIRDPEMVSQLVVLNAPHPAVYRRALRRSPEQLARSWYVLAVQVPWLPERLLEAGEYRLVASMLADTATPDAFTEADVRRYRAAMARSESLSAPLNYYRAAARDTLGRGLRSLLPGTETRDESVRVPTLVIWGERDRALSTDLLDGLDAWVPELRVERLPAASHWVQADEPERVTELLLEELA